MQFPIGQDDKFNITIRAVSDSHGIPIHINSENLSHDGSKLFNYHSKQHDPTLGEFGYTTSKSIHIYNQHFHRNFDWCHAINIVHFNHMLDYSSVSNVFQT